MREASALVTGAASGLGLATARRLVADGWRVVLVDLPTAAGAEAVSAVGEGALFVPADVTDEDQMQRAVLVATGAAPLRAVVHCAGRGGDRRRILDRDGTPAPLGSFAEVVRVNLVGTYNVLRLAAAAMSGNDVVRGDRGAVVLTASVAAFEGQVGQTSYTAAKAGVHGMTIVAARDLASVAIRVNTIAPGVFDTAMLGRLPQQLRDDLAAGIPHPKRLGHPDDFASLAAELIANPYLNGQTVRLDGALRMAPR